MATRFAPAPAMLTAFLCSYAAMLPPPMIALVNTLFMQNYLCNTL